MNGSTNSMIVGAVILPENPRRRYFACVNDSDTKIYIGHGLLATGQGIPLSPNGSFEDKPDTTGWLYLGTWNCISAADTKNLSWIEESYQ